MAGHPEPSLEELLWTAAVARLVLPADVHVQCPPNLSYDDFPRLLDAGIDDWGGVSPVTIDHVNPEAPWPEIERLRAGDRGPRPRARAAAARLPGVPRRRVARAARAHRRRCAPPTRDGLAREDGWFAGAADAGAVRPPRRAPDRHRRRARRGRARAALRRPRRGAAPRLRCGRPAPPRGERRRGHATSSRGTSTTRTSATSVRLLRVLEGEARREPARPGVRRARPRRSSAARTRRGSAARSRSASRAGSTPASTATTTSRCARRSSASCPDLHVHAFSALEVWQGAATLGVPLDEYLARLRDVGLASLPGTAAEILDDEVRRVLCPDKVNTEQWLEVHETAHRRGLRSTATIMFGHVDTPRSWARHLLRVRELQQRTGGFTEFVPLPFVHMEAPIYLKGLARAGPTFREALLMHAVARLALHPWITNVQASWVKLGPRRRRRGARGPACNDLGGTLMNESISRAAGASHGQELPPERMEEAIRAAGPHAAPAHDALRDAPPERVAASFGAAPLAEPLNPPVDTSRLKRPGTLIRPGLVRRRPMFQPSVETMPAEERAALQEQRLDALVTRLKASTSRTGAEARRPGGQRARVAAVHGQGGAPRPLPVRNARGPARRHGADARVVRHARQADDRRVHDRRPRRLRRCQRPGSRRDGRAARRRAPRRLRLRPVHGRARPPLRRQSGSARRSCLPRAATSRSSSI